MKTRDTLFVLILTALAMVVTVACSGDRTGDATTDTSRSESTDDVVVSDSLTAADTTAIDMSDENVAVQETEVPVADTKSASNSKRPASGAQYSGGKETLYVSTYGANGKVWGHVTMNGKTGRGTIHDESENSYSITVTRHGGELFGTDQNGRQYVFRM